MHHAFLTPSLSNQFAVVIHSCVEISPSVGQRLRRTRLSRLAMAWLGLRISPLEKRAWANRNRSAHGSALKADHGNTIRETKILKTLLHRVVLKAAGASDRYHDYYTLHFPVRNIDDPITEGGWAAALDIPGFRATNP